MVRVELSTTVNIILSSAYAFLLDNETSYVLQYKTPYRTVSAIANNSFADGSLIILIILRIILQDVFKDSEKERIFFIMIIDFTSRRKRLPFITRSRVK